MARKEATNSRQPIDGGATMDAARLARADRREALLDAAAVMVGDGEVDDVSMESVADASGVSRALVYKHFSNRLELLSALYERESAHLHAHLTAAVQKAEGLAGKLHALITGALEAQAAQGTTFAALGQSGSRTRAQRDRQRRRDGRTQRYFTQVALEEFVVEPEVAMAFLGVALGAIPSILRQWRQRPTEKHAELLADCYVAMVMGGLEELARHRGR